MDESVMETNAETETDGEAETDGDARADGGVAVDLDRDELYAVVREALRDAILDVLGTVSLLAIALVFVFVGARGVVVGSSTTIGVAFVVGGVLLAAAALEFVPPFRG